MFNNSCWKAVLFIFLLSSGSGPQRSFGLVYLLPLPWARRHKDGSRPLTARPSVWYPDHPPTSHGNFHFRKIFMGRHLLPGWKNPSSWTKIIYSYPSFNPLHHVLRALMSWECLPWEKSHKSHKIMAFHHRRALVCNRHSSLPEYFVNNESLTKQTPK